MIPALFIKLYSDYHFAAAAQSASVFDIVSKKKKGVRYPHTFLSLMDISLIRWTAVYAGTPSFLVLPLNTACTDPMSLMFMTEPLLPAPWPMQVVRCSVPAAKAP